MSAAEALKAARAAGVELTIDGDELVLEASTEPPNAVLDLLSRHKADIVALLARAHAREAPEGVEHLRATNDQKPSVSAAITEDAHHEHLRKEREILRLSESVSAEDAHLTCGFPRAHAREATADPAEWRALFEERAVIRQFDGRYSRTEAERLAWGELQNRWYRLHGERVPRHLCAGCRRPIGTAEALDLIDGSRVHLADCYDCLIRHGERWRGAATRALVAMGLCQPARENEP